MLQDQNAGNLGDLLKHFWLLRLVECVLEHHEPTAVAYLESHAGAGRFELDPKRIRRLEQQKSEICADPRRWEAFERYNHLIPQGTYFGSFVQILARLAQWRCTRPGVEIRSELWESAPEAWSRIAHYRSQLLPRNAQVTLRHEASTPSALIQRAQALHEGGSTVIWLCDPYWGRSRRVDRIWWDLLAALPRTYGVIFALVGGNSQERGSAKFDFVKTIGAPSSPWRQVPENIRAYGLYLTDAARRLLG